MKEMISIAASGIWFTMTALIVSLAATGTVGAQGSRGIDNNNCTGEGRVCPQGVPLNSGNASSRNAQSGNNAAAAQVLMQSTLQAFTQLQEDSDRREEERQREQERIQREQASEQQRIARQQREQQEQMQQRALQIEADDRARYGSSKDNPWGGGGAGSAAGDVPGASGAQSGPLDPAADYTGQSCRYFTCNAVRGDGGGINYHANGAFIIYGKVAYRCDAGHWSKRGPASVWLPAAENSKAENAERGCNN